jgi:hypothetical protein
VVEKKLPRSAEVKRRCIEPTHKCVDGGRVPGRFCKGGVPFDSSCWRLLQKILRLSVRDRHNACEQDDQGSNDRLAGPCPGEPAVGVRVGGHALGLQKV